MIAVEMSSYSIHNISGSISDNERCRDVEASTAVAPTVNMIAVEMSVAASLPSASITDVKRSTTLMTFINI